MTLGIGHVMDCFIDQGRLCWLFSFLQLNVVDNSVLLNTIQSTNMNLGVHCVSISLMWVFTVNRDYSLLMHTNTCAYSGWHNAICSKRERLVKSNRQTAHNVKIDGVSNKRLVKHFDAFKQNHPYWTCKTCWTSARLVIAFKADRNAQGWAGLEQRWAET
jgi:hypothetical protein